MFGEIYTPLPPEMESEQGAGSFGNRHASELTSEEGFRSLENRLNEIFTYYLRRKYRKCTALDETLCNDFTPINAKVPELKTALDSLGFSPSIHDEAAMALWKQIHSQDLIYASKRFGEKDYQIVALQIYLAYQLEQVRLSRDYRRLLDNLQKCFMTVDGEIPSTANPVAQSVLPLPGIMSFLPIFLLSCCCCCTSEYLLVLDLVQELTSWSQFISDWCPHSDTTIHTQQLRGRRGWRASQTGKAKDARSGAEQEMMLLQTPRVAVPTGEVISTPAQVDRAESPVHAAAFFDCDSGGDTGGVGNGWVQNDNGQLVAVVDSKKDSYAHGVAVAPGAK